jgi:hypothetical protein
VPIHRWSLHPEAAVRVYELGLQPKVSHYWNPALRYTLNHILMAIDAFQLHRLRPRAHQSVCAIERRGLALAIGEKRHVGHHEFAPAPRTTASV